MTVKGGSSASDETAPLIPSGPPPPTYQDSQSGSQSGDAPRSYPQQPLYPAIPPSAPTGGAHPQGPSPFHALPLPVPVHSQASAIQAADRRARWRFFEALVWGFAIYVCVGLITGSIVIDERSYKNHRREHHRNGLETTYGEGECVPMSSDDFGPPSLFQFLVKLHPVTSYLFSAASSSSPTTSIQTFEMPFGPQMVLYLNAHVGHGKVTIVVDDSLKHDKFIVSVLATGVDGIERDGRLHLAEVCPWMEDDVVAGGDALSSGITLQGPSGFSHSLPFTFFNILLRVPTTLTSKNSLNISASSFTISSSSSLPLLNAINIHTSNSPIHFHSIEASTISLTTTNAPISLDHATAATSLFAKTTDGKIVGSFESGKSLELVTSNGKVDARVGLLEGEKRERFEVTIKTSNAPVELVYKSQPKDTVLESGVFTTNAKVSVVHAEEYQGSFKVITSNEKATINGPPTKEGRNFSELPGNSRTVREGNVWWESSENKVRGRSIVRTSNALGTIEFA